MIFYIIVFLPLNISSWHSITGVKTKGRLTQSSEEFRKVRQTTYPAS